MAVEIRVLGPDDLPVLLNVADDVFDHPIQPEYAQEFLSDPRHHLAVAIDAGIVVGFASAVHYLHPDAAPQLWINEVGVADSHLRQGLGRALLRRLFDVGRSHHCTEAWVLTHRGNEAANALYRSLGGLDGADDESDGETVGYTFPLRP